MLLKLRVIYERQEVVYDMPVGDGRMTVKWLGLAAAQRFSAMVKPGGRRRHRETPGPAKIVSTSANLLPSRVYTRESPFLHPEKSIREEVKEGQEVFVMLTSKMAVNQIGRTQRDRWTFIAFNVSDQNEQERDAAIADEYKLMEQARERHQREELARKRDIAAIKGVQMRRVMVSQLYSAEKVEAAFDRDWSALCHPVLRPIDMISEDVEEKTRIRDAMLANYVTLVEVFKHYASVGSAVSTGELDLMEFSAFMHDLRGFSAAKSREVVEKTFSEAVGACKGDKARSTAGTMGICEFIFSAMRLACMRHCASNHPHGVSCADSAAGSSNIRLANSVHDAVLMYMESVMVPLAQRKVIGLQIKTALDSDDILALYYDSDANLKAVFDRYCKVGDRAGGPAALGALLNITEFGMVLREAGLMGGNDKEDDELTVKEARQAFAGAQNDLCGGDDAASPRLKEEGLTSEQMTYPEFLEGIARVAILKWDDASMTALDKIGRAVVAVASLVDNTPS